MEITDKTRPIFAIFEPIILFNAMDGEPFKAALILTTSSGSEVANAITVIPIINLGNLNFNETETDARVINSPPITNKKNTVRACIQQRGSYIVRRGSLNNHSTTDNIDTFIFNIFPRS